MLQPGEAQQLLRTLRVLQTRKSLELSDSQLHDHDHFWLLVVGGQALDQLRVVEVVHQLDLLAGGVSLFGTPTLIELAGTHTSRLFVD